MEQKFSSVDIHWRYLRKIALSFLILISVWGGADVLLTTFGRTPSHTVNELQYVDGLGMVMRRGWQYNTSYINTDGFRRSELPPLATKEIRILVLGDSVTYGTYLAEGEDWPAMLEKYLRQHGVPATVMNAGSPGKMTDYMLRALKYYKQRMKIDLVLVQNTGNIISFSTHDPNFTDTNPDSAGRYLFPSYGIKNLTPRPECYGEPIDKETQKAATLDLPVILKILSFHSPIINESTSFLKTITPNHISVKKQSFSKGCYQNGGGIFEREMLSMGQLIQYAAESHLPIIFLNPSYVFKWKTTLNTNILTALNTPDLYKTNSKKLYDVIDRIDKMFIFFQTHSNAFFISPISLLKSKYGSPRQDEDLKKLYLDYAHFSPQGASKIAEMIGQDMIDRKLLLPIVKGEWSHPSEHLNQSRDLLYRDIPASFNFLEIILSAMFFTLLTVSIGTATRLLLFGQQEKYDIASPMLGFFVLLTGGMLNNNFSFDPYSFYKYGTMVSIAVIFFFMIKNKSIIARTIFCALFASTASIVCAALAIIFIQHPPLKITEQHIQNIKTEIAFAEYLTSPVFSRALQNDLYQRQQVDGISRPLMIPNIATLYPATIYPASPSLPAFFSRVSNISPQNAVIGSFAAFSSSLFLFILMIFLSLKQKKFWVAVPVAFIGITITAATTLYFPTQLAMLLIAGVLLVFLAVFSKDISNSWMQLVILMLGGGILYIFPAKWFVALIFFITFLSSAQAYLKSRNARISVLTGICVLVYLLSSRIVIFNMNVVDAHLYALLDNLNLNHFFL